ncbi:MAG: acyltransferase [Litoreibacter sp.]|nr:acyltransferase [Litoreibacter sp.]MCY4333179.1 acyltransferase [Litoreibacter sp.]
MTDLPLDTQPFRKARRRGLNRLRLLREVLVQARRLWLSGVYGMDIAPTSQISMSARLDRTFPIGVHIGAQSYVALQSMVLTHDRTRGLYVHTWIGRNCFIGARSMILPGVRIGDGSIVAAGAVVTKDVPPDCIVAGNPAKVVRQGISAGPFGRLPDADLREHELAAAGLT